MSVCSFWWRPARMEELLAGPACCDALRRGRSGRARACEDASLDVGSGHESRENVGLWFLAATGENGGVVGRTRMLRMPYGEDVVCSINFTCGVVMGRVCCAFQ